MALRLVQPVEFGADCGSIGIPWHCDRSFLRGGYVRLVGRIALYAWIRKSFRFPKKIVDILKRMWYAYQEEILEYVYEHQRSESIIAYIRKHVKPFRLYI